MLVFSKSVISCKPCLCSPECHWTSKAPEMDSKVWERYAQGGFLMSVCVTAQLLHLVSQTQWSLWLHWGESYGMKCPWERSMGELLNFICALQFWDREGRKRSWGWAAAAWIFPLFKWTSHFWKLQNTCNFNIKFLRANKSVRKEYYRLTSYYLYFQCLYIRRNLCILLAGHIPFA